MRTFISIFFILTGAVIPQLHAAQPIARWAYPDHVSVRDTVHIGMVAYSAEGIERVDFSLDGGAVTSVTAETQNPSTGEFEYVYTVVTNSLADGDHAVSGTIYPSGGTPVTMDDLTIDAVNGLSFNAVTVNPAGGGDYTNIGDALDNAVGGDTVYLADGEHSVPDSWNTAFERFVIITPAAGAAPVITNSPNLRKGFLKFVGVTCDGRDLGLTANLMRSYSAGNFWFDGCTFKGVGKENYNNGQSAFRMTGSVCRNVVIENCEIFGTARAFVVTGPQSIIRNCHIYDLSSDVWNPGSEILITGNEIHGIEAPKLFLEADGTPPFDFSTDKALQISHCEATNSCDSAGYNVYLITDMGSEAADPSATTMQEAIDALNANADFYQYCWAEERDGKLRMYARRSNYVQQMWVTGSANNVLAIPNNSLENEASGAGAHSDIFQYWGTIGTIDTTRDIIFRNNKSYNNYSQGIYPGSRSHSINTVFVNNLMDGASKGGWNVNFAGSPDAGERFENVLFAFNTIWDKGQALLFSNDSAQVDVTMYNNVLGRRALGAGDRTAAGFTMDYNYWISYYGRPTTVGPNSIYQEVTLEDGGDLFTYFAYDAETEDDTSSFMPAEASPLRDVGTDALGIVYDIDWNLRDDTPDMGCSEYIQPSYIRMTNDKCQMTNALPGPNPVSIAQVRSLGDGVRLIAADGTVLPAVMVTEAGVYYMTAAEGAVRRIVVVK